MTALIGSVLLRTPRHHQFKLQLSSSVVLLTGSFDYANEVIHTTSCTSHLSPTILRSNVRKKNKTTALVYPTVQVSQF